MSRRLARVLPRVRGPSKPPLCPENAPLGQQHHAASRPRRHYETVASCPEPTCSCAATPDMPPGLEIDGTSRMAMPYYDRHVVIAGDSDAQAWPSKLESNPATLYSRLKKALGPSGAYYRPDIAVSVTASTLPNADDASTTTRSVYVFPDFVQADTCADRELAQGRPAAEEALDGLARAVSRDAAVGTQISSKPISKPVVLICGHGQRDQRCGIYGQLLEAEFRRQFWGPEAQADAAGNPPVIGLVSHVGGHKFAGNVIIYLPPQHETTQGKSRLAGHAIWYGRVEPKHVEGIIKETILGGKIIESLLRGVHDFGKSPHKAATP